MKKVILGMMVATVMSFGGEWDIKKGDSYCVQDSKMAYTIMKARQQNVPMINMIKGMSESAIAMIKMAYLEPRYYGKALQEDTQVDFANRVYQLCPEAGKNHTKENK